MRPNEIVLMAAMMLSVVPAPSLELGLEQRS